MAADENVKKVAMFLVGFTMLAPIRLAMTCAKFSIKRFQLPVERVGLFINITKNTMELAGFFSVLIGKIIIWCNKDDKELPKICSLFTNWLMFVMSIMSLVAYKSGGDSGNLNFYFWTIVFYTSMYKINYLFSVKVDPDNITLIHVGRPLFSIFVSVYHNLFLYFANKYEMNNIDYWIVYGQMVIMIIFTCATALLWTYSTYSEPITIVAKCFYEAFVKKSGSQATSQAQPQEQASTSCCCCCCEKCKAEKGNSCSCNAETPKCNFCKVAKLLCCLCKDGTQCGKCLSELPTAFGQLSNCDNGDSLKCTCICIENIDCCRIKRFIEFYEALCNNYKSSECLCVSTITLVLVRIKTCSFVHNCLKSCYKILYKAVIDFCQCCDEKDSCLREGKCNLVNVLKCLFGNETCQSTCGTKDGKLCNCVLAVFSKVKCKLTTKVCGKCCPCIANNGCNIKGACALCWRRFFRCYIICGGNCKQKEDGEGCKCCCVGEEGCDENQCDCCTASPETSTQCLCPTDQLCCCCCKNCEQSCKRSCTTACTGGQGCTCCKAGNCCCCCENCSKTELIKYECQFMEIFYEYRKNLKNTAKVIYKYLEELYHCTTETIEEPLCKCCCCKSPEDSCPCPGHQQVEEKECRCCCCKSGESSEPEVKEPTQNNKCGSSSNGKVKLWDEFKKPLLWSPAMIVIFVNGTMYSVYPGVSPYQLVSADVGYKIGLIILLLSPIIPIAICILDIYCLGPSKKWEKKDVGWHAVWAGPIYAVICIILFFYTLHYPESMIGKNIYGNNILVGLLTVSYLMVQEGLKSIGPTATKSQVQNKDNKGTISTTIYFISLVFANASGFIGDGYLQTFRKHSRDNWPTKGYTRYRGFKFWLGSACKVAVKSILNAFNSDIRARIESFS